MKINDDVIRRFYVLQAKRKKRSLDPGIFSKVIQEKLQADIEK